MCDGARNYTNIYFKYRFRLIRAILSWWVKCVKSEFFGKHDTHANNFFTRDADVFAGETAWGYLKSMCWAHTHTGLLDPVTLISSVFERESALSRRDRRKWLTITERVHPCSGNGTVSGVLPGNLEPPCNLNENCNLQREPLPESTAHHLEVIRPHMRNITLVPVHSDACFLDVWKETSGEERIKVLHNHWA